MLPNITESVHAPPGRRAHHIRAHPRAQDPHVCAPSHFTWAQCREKIHPLSTCEKTKAWAGFSGHSSCFWVEEGWEPIPTGPCCPLLCGLILAGSTPLGALSLSVSREVKMNPSGPHPTYRTNKIPFLSVAEDDEDQPSCSY